MNVRSICISISCICSIWMLPMPSIRAADCPIILAFYDGLEGVRLGQNVLIDSFISNCRPGIKSNVDSTGWWVRGPAMPESKMRLRSLDITGTSAANAGESHMLRFSMEFTQDGTNGATDDDSIQLGVLLIAFNSATGQFVLIESLPKVMIYRGIPIDSGISTGQGVQAGTYLGGVLVIGAEHDDSPIQFVGLRLNRVVIADR